MAGDREAARAAPTTEAPEDEPSALI
jgi:hypothetical protein